MIAPRTHVHGPDLRDNAFMTTSRSSQNIGPEYCRKASYRASHLLTARFSRAAVGWAKALARHFIPAIPIVRRAHHLNLRKHHGPWWARRTRGFFV